MDVQSNELLSKYSEQQQTDLCAYAQNYCLTITQAIEYQTCCHNCGREIQDGKFDDINHQYCNKRCFKYTEDYYYPCFREGNCLVCSTWQYHEDLRQMEMSYDEVIEEVPVLAISCVENNFTPVNSSKRANSSKPVNRSKSKPKQPSRALVPTVKVSRFPILNGVANDDNCDVALPGRRRSIQMIENDNYQVDEEDFPKGHL
jgi:hypothetical protein